MKEFKTREDVLRGLEDPILNDRSYRRDADDIEKIENEFEKKVVTAPLVGNGAGLLLCANFLGKDATHSDFFGVVVISSWSFFLGVVAIIFGGIAYIVHLSKCVEAKRCLGDAQASFHTLYKSLRRDKPAGYVPEDISLNDAGESLMKPLMENLEKHLRLYAFSDRFLYLARFLFLLSAVGFCIGVFVPLFSVT